MRTIAVRGENGDDLTVYEFHDRRFLKKVRRLKLCTGQTVQQFDGDFVVLGTGERLLPVAADEEAVLESPAAGQTMV